MDQADVVNRFARTDEKHVKDRQSSIERTRPQVLAQVCCNEITEGKNIAQRSLDISERWSDRAAWQFHQIWNRARRLKAAEHVSRCLRKKRIRIEKIRTAEHV